MKRFLTILFAAMVCCSVAMAKDMKVLVVKTSPEIHCQDCENKIKNNLRFVSGVRKIVTSLEQKVVAITYDAEKTDAKTIVAAFKKIGFAATVVSDKQKAEKGSVDGQTGASQVKK